MRKRATLPYAHAARGTSMIELLSAMIVVSIGLLGISNLQSRALKTSQDSYFVSQATLFLDDIAERMRANHANGDSAAGNYNFINNMTDYSDLTAAQKAQDCVGFAANCTPAQMAVYDVARWLQSMTQGNRALPSAKAKITWAATTATVTVRWQTNFVDSGNCDVDGTISAAQDYRCLTTTVALP